MGGLMRASSGAASLGGVSPAELEMLFFFFSSRRRHTRLQGDWSSDVCSSDLELDIGVAVELIVGNATAKPWSCPDPVRVLGAGWGVFVGAAVNLVPRFALGDQIGRASCRERV